ncbi:hypothetical protein F4808DRAFT_462378 [Astrocystis sublimbata]|nr:hypothetical protein F4808DRAFT_462378 [Astrocystis sublimbata]
MASPESHSGKLLVRDLVALDDIELNQLLERNRLRDRSGDRFAFLDIEDPENLTESLIQRLRGWARGPGSSTQALDLDEVNNRLLELPVDHANLPRTISEERNSAVSTLPPTPGITRERDNCNQLMNEGGRPLYSIDLIDDVAANPEAHRDMLRPWRSDRDGDNPGWEVFADQLQSWTRFRKFQEYYRREEVYFYPAGEIKQNFLTDFRHTSPTYFDAAKKLLEHYGFRRPFELEHDPKQQDKLTTWIEYLVFMYAIHYMWTCVAKKERPAYDRAWKKLVDAKVLRPSDTEEWLCDITSAFALQGEIDQAWRDLNSAEEDLNSVQGAVDSSGDPDAQEAANADASAAQCQLDAAREALKELERYDDLTTQFSQEAREYLCNMDKVKHYDFLTKWILSQIPLIEAEMGESTAIEPRPSSAHCTIEQRSAGDAQNTREEPRRSKRLKRTLDDDTEAMGPLTKRTRTNGGKLVSQQPQNGKTRTPSTRQKVPDRMTRTRKQNTTKAATKNLDDLNRNPVKPSHHYLQGEGSKTVPRQSETAVPLRRSARIAARQQASAAEVAQPSPVARIPSAKRRNKQRHNTRRAVK